MKKKKKKPVAASRKTIIRRKTVKARQKILIFRSRFFHSYYVCMVAIKICKKYVMRVYQKKEKKKELNEYEQFRIILV